ncbi:MAG: S1 RNA-binding domain-containing protein [Candidatus Paceibacterota bacterium]
MPSPVSKNKRSAKSTTSQPKKPKTSSSVNSMEALLAKSPITPPKRGTDVDAKIIKLSKRGMLFDIGWKSYAVLGELETAQLTSYLPYLKEGDTVKVRVVVEEAKDGYPVVSMRSFFDRGKWEILQRKYKAEDDIEVMCGSYGKGGVFVEFMGIRGVIPKIQLTDKYINHPEKLEGQKIKVRVLEVDPEKNRLVVSQKASVLNISYKDIQKKFDETKIGKTYKAKVIGFSEFGAFCEVNKIEGLIHISEISWSKVSDARQHLSIGDEVDVVVVEKNKANLKLNLSLKRLKGDPWKAIEKRYKKDKEIKGEIVRRERYGYIVRLEPGVEGLIHISKLTGREKIEVGKKLGVFIEKIDQKNRRISLVLVPHEKPVVYR